MNSKPACDVLKANAANLKESGSQNMGVSRTWVQNMGVRPTHLTKAVPSRATDEGKNYTFCRIPFFVKYVDPWAPPGLMFSQELQEDSNHDRKGCHKNSQHR